MWITGGKGAIVLDSTDFIDMNPEDGTFSTSPGPDLPTKVQKHCLTKISATEVMLIGGSGGNKNKTWTFDFEKYPSETWHSGPDLIQVNITRQDKSAHQTSH